MRARILEWKWLLVFALAAIPLALAAYVEFDAAFISTSIDWLNDNSGAINAIAAAFVAAFTFTLWRSTKQLWRTSLDQFCAAHPPAIEVRQAYIDFDAITEAGKTIGGVYVFNSGGNDAFIRGIGNAEPPTYGNILLYVGKHPPARRPFDIAPHANPLLVKDGVLKAGESQWWKIADTSMVAPEEIAEVQTRRNSKRLYMIGRIHFMDRRGGYRQTVFCRVYDPESGRFKPTKDFDYEYVR